MGGHPVVLALALLGTPAADAIRVRAGLGVEFDTNARRAVDGRELDLPGLDEEVVGDALGRVVVDVAGGLEVGAGHRLRLGLTLGAKRFVAEATEDLVAQALRFDGHHRLGPEWRVTTHFRGRSSRIRDGSRDYDLASGGAGLTFAPGAFDVGVRAQLFGFRFLPERNYDHLGPSVRAEAGWRPVGGARVAAFAGRAWRIYDGQGLVIAEPLPGADVGPKLTFCEDPDAERAAGRTCSSRPRRDADWLAGIRATYRGQLVLSGGYDLRVQRSSSALENVDRHHIFASVVLTLPWQVDLGLEAALQINDGAAVSDTLQLAEADESQNAAQLKLSRPLTAWLDVELRYSLFASQFGPQTRASFLRQTVYAGVATHVAGS
jgi:hypothetical protein